MWWWPPHAQDIAAFSWSRWCGSRRAVLGPPRPRPRRRRKQPPAPPFAVLLPARGSLDDHAAGGAGRAGGARRRSRLRPAQLGSARRARLGDAATRSGRCRFGDHRAGGRPTASCTSARATRCTRSTPPPAPRAGRVTPSGTPAARWRSRARASSAWAPASRTPSTRRPARMNCGRGRSRRPVMRPGSPSRRRRSVRGLRRRTRHRARARRRPRPVGAADRRAARARRSLRRGLALRRLDRQAASTRSTPATASRAGRGGPGGDVTGADADAKAVYYTSLDAVVRAVNPGNGHQRWKRDVGTRAPVGPIALDGTVLVTGLSPCSSAFEPLKGTPLGHLRPARRGLRHAARERRR